MDSMKRYRISNIKWVCIKNKSKKIPKVIWVESLDTYDVESHISVYLKTKYGKDHEEYELDDVTPYDGSEYSMEEIIRGMTPVD